MQRPTVIYLCGTSRSGSTLVQRVLEMSSDAVALGEVARLPKLAAEGRACSCGQQIRDCPFWQRALPYAGMADAAWSRASWGQKFAVLRSAGAAISGLPRLAPPASHRAAEALKGMLQALGEGRASPVFVDSSKDPSQLLRHVLSGYPRVIPVHIVRDPRGVAWSGYQRTGTGPLPMARHWLRLNRAFSFLRHAMPRLPWQVVRYEDFCRDPAGISAQILAASGLSPLVTPTRRSSHAIGGSPAFVLQDPQSVKLDERWRAEMPADIQARIMNITGHRARALGYT